MWDFGAHHNYVKSVLCTQNLFETLEVIQKLALKLSVPLLAVKKLWDLLNNEKKNLWKFQMRLCQDFTNSGPTVEV